MTAPSLPDVLAQSEQVQVGIDSLRHLTWVNPANAVCREADCDAWAALIADATRGMQRHDRDEWGVCSACDYRHHPCPDFLAHARTVQRAAEWVERHGGGA